MFEVWTFYAGRLSACVARGDQFYCNAYVLQARLKGAAPGSLVVVKGGAA